MIQLTKEDVNKAMNEYMLCDTVRSNEKLAEIFNQLLASKQQPQEQPPQKKKVEWEYKMEKGDRYYYIEECGLVKQDEWDKDLIDHYRYKMGNCFHTEEEAEAKKKYDLLFADYCELIRQTNEKAGLVLDWGDDLQNKIYIFYNHFINESNTLKLQTLQHRNDKEYWLIPQEEILPLLREYFTDLELKAIATKNHKLLMEDNK